MSEPSKPVRALLAATEAGPLTDEQRMWARHRLQAIDHNETQGMLEPHDLADQEALQEIISVNEIVQAVLQSDVWKDTVKQVEAAVSGNTGGVVPGGAFVKDDS